MKQILILFLLSIGGQLFAQAPVKLDRFPIPLLPGDEFTIQEEYVINDSVFKVDQLWLLKNSQYKTALKIAKKQEIDSARVSLLAQQVAIHKQIGAEKDSIIALNRAGYLHYRDLWNETDRKLEEEEIKSARNFRWGFYVGAAVSVVIVTAFKVIADRID